MPRRRMEEELASRDVIISDLRGAVAVAEADGASRRAVIMDMRDKNRALEQALSRTHTELTEARAQLASMGALLELDMPVYGDDGDEGEYVTHANNDSPVSAATGSSGPVVAVPSSPSPFVRRKLSDKPPSYRSLMTLPKTCLPAGSRGGVWAGIGGRRSALC